MYRNPVERLDVLFRSGEVMTSGESPEMQMFRLASEGAIDLHVVMSGEDQCKALVYTLPGEQPIMNHDQVGWVMSPNDIQAELDALQTRTDAL